MPSRPITLSAAKAEQLMLRDRVIRGNRFPELRFVAGVDVGFEQHNRAARGAVAVLRFPSLEPVDSAVARRPVEFPYIPGYLSFREIPVIRKALSKLQQQPDMLLCDGQGIAHPRRIGIASHLGVICDLPSIGVAKTRLIGEFEEPGREKGAWSLLIDRGETIGAVLRTRTGVKPLFVSIGHRIDLETSIEIVLACCTRYKLPETTRAAHRLASG
ncbi:MAG: deoxyribonuclease V [Pseudomonadota bacterium]|nr:deoxyribonuclease V [Pseudomonadota bacterium]